MKRHYYSKKEARFVYRLVFVCFAVTAAILFALLQVLT